MTIIDRNLSACRCTLLLDFVSKNVRPKGLLFHRVMAVYIHNLQLIVRYFLVSGFVPDPTEEPSSLEFQKYGVF